MKYVGKTAWIAALIAAVALIVGCAETKRAKSVKESGFLSDYSRLQKGGEEEALLRYRAPEADFKSYRQVFIVPVKIFKPKEASDAEIADLQRLAGNFNAYLVRELKRDYAIVQEPGPGTMKVEAAVTGAEKSGPVMDLMGSVIPFGMAISAGKDFATGKPTGVGEVSAEMRITDASTGKVLAEAVDRRVGGKDPEGMFNSWNDADRAMEYWARRLAYVLCMEREGAGCVAP